MAFTSEHFEIREPAPGVYALIAGDLGTCVSNATIVDLGDKAVVVDTFMTLPAGDDLVAAVRALTGRDAFLAVTSHWHDDHTGGNQLFADRPIVSTRRTMELIAAQGTFEPEIYAEEVEAFLTRARELEAQAETEQARSRARAMRRGAEALVANSRRFRLTLPDLFVDDRLEVRGGERTLEILTYGGGHTESDVFAWVPGAGTVIAGDLLWVDVHPRTNDGDPAAWADILDRIQGLGATTFVPGHGEVGGPQHVADVAAYLRVVDGLVQAVRSGEIDQEALSEVDPPPGSQGWRDPHRLADGIRALLGSGG